MTRIRALCVKRAQRALARSAVARQRSTVAVDGVRERLLQATFRRGRPVAGPAEFDAATKDVLRRVLDGGRP